MTQIAIGDQHSVVLGTDAAGHGIWMYGIVSGSEYSIEVSRAISLEPFNTRFGPDAVTAVAAGKHHTCFVTESGKLFMSGMMHWVENLAGTMRCQQFPLQMPTLVPTAHLQDRAVGHIARSVAVKVQFMVGLRNNPRRVFSMEGPLHILNKECALKIVWYATQPSLAAWPFR